MLTATWSYAWSHEHHFAAQVLLSLNLAALLYGVFMLLHVEQDDIITPSNLMTHLVMKTGTGLAVLFMWTNYGIFNVCVSILSLQKNLNWNFLATVAHSYSRNGRNRQQRHSLLAHGVSDMVTSKLRN